MRVEIGFIATRTTSGSPVVMPPSVPPARFVARSKPGRISSCTSDPLRRAASNPSPSSTPFTAGMDMSAWARRPSSLRSQDTWDPRPTGTPRATTSTIPPSVSPAAFAASIRAIISRSASGSRHRTRLSSATALSGVGSGRGTRATTPPSSTTWLPISTPNASSRIRHRAPAATRATVSRALARSRMSRASRRSYLRTPTKSACPGRGRVTWRRRSSPGASASGAITSCQCSQSRFHTSIATGDPSVSPARTPASHSIWSASIFIRAPRP